MSQKKLWIVRLTGASVVIGMLAVAGVAYAQAPTFSQSSVTVGSGQSTTISSQNGVSVYMESNSAPTVVGVTTNGTQVELNGLAPGTASVTLCAVGTASDCTNLYVTVQVGAVSGLTFSQSSVSLTSGSSQSVTISGGSGSYSISSNSNINVASVNLSGSTITISALTAGSANIVVCDASNSSTCGTISVTVSTSGSGSSGLTFSQSNLSLTAGSTEVVTIYGGNGVYNITNNSNSSVVSVGMSGTTGIILDALSAGTTNITVCDTSNTNTCGTLPVTVTGSVSGGNQGVTFSVSNPTLAVGQTLNVQLSGGATTYVVFWNQNAGIAQASISGGSTLVLSGVTSGSDSLTICATLGSCSPLSVTVSGTATPTTTTTSTTTTPVTTTNTTTPTQPAAGVVVNATLLSELQAIQTSLTQTLSQIQSIQTQINQLVAQVNAGSGSTISASAAASSGNATFTELLMVGSQDAQVTALQGRLTTLGFYSGPISGFYGSLTESAVMKYQTSHGIEATGEVGPSTRAALNAGN